MFREKAVLSNNRGAKLWFSLEALLDRIKGILVDIPGKLDGMVFVHYRVQLLDQV